MMTVTNQSTSFIPLIDFSRFLNGSPPERKQVAQAILAGFQSAGFIYLKNIPIPAEDISRAFATSTSFFQLPLDQKAGLGWTSPEANRGYSSMGREKVNDSNDASEVQKLKSVIPDLKESFEIGRDNEEAYPNRWPGEDTFPGFKPVMKEFFAQCQDLHVQVMRAIAVGIGLDETYFDSYVDVADNNLRLLHYPSVSREVFEADSRQVRAGAHTDYGTITLLFQDEKGGLQIESPTGGFVDATPIQGTVVVNAGDLLARWSNDTIRSTVHRVVKPPVDPVEEGYPARYSIAYFCHPNHKDTIDVIPGTYASAAEKKYGPVNTMQYIVQRLTATY